MENEYLLIHALCLAKLNLYPCHIHFLMAFDQPFVTSVKCGFATREIYLVPKLIGFGLLNQSQGIDSLQTLNTLSDYECTSL